MRMKITQRRRVMSMPPPRAQTPYNRVVEGRSITQDNQPSTSAATRRINLGVEDIVSEIPQLTITPEAGWEGLEDPRPSNLGNISEVNRNVVAETSRTAQLKPGGVMTSAGRSISTDNPIMAQTPQSKSRVVTSVERPTDQAIPVQQSEYAMANIQPEINAQLSDSDLIRWLYSLRISKPRYRRHQTVLYYHDRPAVKVTFLNDYARLQCRGLMVHVRLISNDQRNSI
ncbi:uncharacterized protein [Musca autumnalis]|uniref:uncharacterized protein n=1 Tax=Musca autumnalis TaxID=221902 RepID=UPI003CEA57BF